MTLLLTANTVGLSWIKLCISSCESFKHGDSWAVTNYFIVAIKAKQILYIGSEWHLGKKANHNQDQKQGLISWNLNDYYLYAVLRAHFYFPYLKTVKCEIQLLFTPQAKLYEWYLQQCAAEYDLWPLKTAYTFISVYCVRENPPPFIIWCWKETADHQWNVQVFLVYSVRQLCDLSASRNHSQHFWS